MRMQWCSLFVALSVGCAPSADLYVDLYTDFVPVAEFDMVSLAVSPEGAPTTFTWRHAMTDPHERYVDVPRRFSLGTFTPGPTAVEVRLDHRGRALVGRWTPRTLPSGATVLSVYLFRGCLDVTCPGVGDRAEETECDSGECVVPDCEERGTCADDVCEADDDCAPPLASCAEARCVSGRCAYGERDGACSIERYCDPDVGCLVIPSVDTLVFEELTGVSPSIEYESNEIVATVSRPATATLSGDSTAQLVIEGRGVGRSGTVRPGDRVRLRMFSSSALATTVTATLAFGGLRGRWNVTTGTVMCMTPMAPVAFPMASTQMVTVPDGCGHVVFRLWGAGGGGGRSTCGYVDGEGGHPTILRTSRGAVLAVAGGGGGGTGTNAGASGAYVERRLSVSAGDVFELEIGAGGRFNHIDGGSRGAGPFGGAIEEGGRGLGDLVVPGFAATAPYYTTAPYGGPANYGRGGRSDVNCDARGGAVHPGNAGAVEIVWAY